jgi:hypothetical protein
VKPERRGSTASQRAPGFLKFDFLQMSPNWTTENDVGAVHSVNFSTRSTWRQKPKLSSRLACSDAYVRRTTATNHTKVTNHGPSGVGR